MRCPECSKFVSMEFNDPELESLDVDEGLARANVRIVRVCADCGEELKEASLELEHEFEIPESSDDKNHDLSIEETSIDPIEEGGSRYAKSYFGAKVSFKVSCECGCGFEYEGEMEDKIQASGMDEMT